jgi:hypothetical protein
MTRVIHCQTSGRLAWLSRSLFTTCWDWKPTACQPAWSLPWRPAATSVSGAESRLAGWLLIGRMAVELPDGCRIGNELQSLLKNIGPNREACPKSQASGDSARLGSQTEPIANEKFQPDSLLPALSQRRRDIVSELPREWCPLFVVELDLGVAPRRLDGLDQTRPSLAPGAAGRPEVELTLVRAWAWRLIGLWPGRAQSPANHP